MADQSAKPLNIIISFKNRNVKSKWWNLESINLGARNLAFPI